MFHPVLQKSTLEIKHIWYRRSHNNPAYFTARMLSDTTRNLLCHLFFSHHKHDKVSPNPLFAIADAAPSPHTATNLLFVPRLGCYGFNPFTTTPINCVVLAEPQFTSTWAIPLHWTAAFDLTSYATLQIKSVVTSFPTLFYVIVSFKWFLWWFGWKYWGRDINGSRMLLLFFSFVFPLQHVFLFASDLFQSFSLQDTNGGSHPALGCSSISGGRQGLDLLRTLWAGFLLPAQHESTIHPCRKSCTVNTSFCLLLWSLISRPNSLTIMQMFVDAQKKLPQPFNILKCWTHTVE